LIYKNVGILLGGCLTGGAIWGSIQVEMRLTTLCI